MIIAMITGYKITENICHYHYQRQLCRGADSSIKCNGVTKVMQGLHSEI